MSKLDTWIQTYTDLDIVQEIEAKQRIKDLIRELIGNIPEDWENYNGEMYGVFNERKRMAQEVSDL